MLFERDLQISHEPNVNYFGIELSQTQYQQIRKRMDILKEKCPAHCSIALNFVKRKSRYIGEIMVKSLTETFYSRKIAHNPYHCYLHMEADIEEQLMDWKKRRFNNQKNHESIKHAYA
ncbi:hypothetical protein [Bacteriovorax sp. Seq25_V]|uniref:hypothetical protein n=1 Tax=Bacteriovorax sp. Seq25_V TaxID=1201288 RepID=UPI000389E11A|nr:hypothetical protein [Bacteriovorax sp. Seq25_V]EQC47207.1 hypothetical protein M900_0923 [Bacteriovorax sp. Seq25_V]